MKKLSNVIRYYQKRISEVMKACETSENGLSHEEIIKRHQILSKKNI